MVAESGVIENEQASAAVKTAGSTVQEQAEMDPTEASASESYVQQLLHAIICDTMYAGKVPIKAASIR